MMKLSPRSLRNIAKQRVVVMRRWRPGQRRSVLARNPERLADEIAACVAPKVSETAARTKAWEIGEYYAQLDEADRLRFFSVLAESFGVDRKSIDDQIDKRRDLLAAAPIDQAELLAAERDLRRSLASPRERLFTRLNGLDDGVKFVVDLRADLRELYRGKPGDETKPELGHRAEFQAMDEELKALLSSWFDVGHLTLRQITWDEPASMLERLIEYESVHEIESWDDLKNRLAIDRRCFAFFHPGMADEPLIFVEVALVKGIAGELGELLDLGTPLLDPTDADTAIFYSISNCQEGLAGVNLGDLLIKQVVAALLRDLPHLETFSTLSPIPGFRAWLRNQLSSQGEKVFTVDERRELRTVLNAEELDQAVEQALNSADWPSDPVLAGSLRQPLLRLAAKYLVDEKRGTQEKKQERALCLVANFDISNGARVERLNWLANTSAAGLKRSAGIMVNYRYHPDHISTNHEAYVNESIIPVADEVLNLSKSDQ